MAKALGLGLCFRRRLLAFGSGSGIDSGLGLGLRLCFRHRLLAFGSGSGSGIDSWSRARTQALV